MFIDYSIDFDGDDTVLRVDGMSGEIGLFAFLEWAKQTLRKEHGFKGIKQRDSGFTLELDTPFIDFCLYGEVDSEVRKQLLALSKKTSSLSFEEFKECKENSNTVPTIVSSHNGSSITPTFHFGELKMADENDIYSGEWNCMIRFLKSYDMLNEKEVTELLI